MDVQPHLYLRVNIDHSHPLNIHCLLYCSFSNLTTLYSLEAHSSATKKKEKASLRVSLLSKSVSDMILNRVEMFC